MKAPIPAKIQNSQIEVQTQAVLLGLIEFCLWLQFKLTESKISISRLKKLFGLAAKKKSNTVVPNKVSNIENLESNDIEKCQPNPQQLWDKKKQ